MATKNNMSFLTEDANLTILPYHKILLTHKSVDHLLRVPLEQTYDEFLNDVASLYPDLVKPFTLVDADFMVFNEKKYNEAMESGGPETWLLVQSDKENDYKLERPRFELLKYDVHPNALTQSGSYHFSSAYQAICEFIDNGIQATNSNKVDRKIKIYVYTTQKIICILDNGKGMCAEEIKAFVSYFLTQKDRGFDYKEQTVYGFMDGNISKFGVGATQAGFYLGNTIKVITKKKGSKFINEISISKDKLHERAKYNQPVFVDQKCIRNPGDTSTLDFNEQQCIKFLVDEEVSKDQFTMIVIKEVKSKHLNYISKDNGADLSTNLAHVYHYYIHGICGKLQKLEFKQSSGLVELNKLHEPRKPNINISISIDKGGCQKFISLADVDTDLQSQYQARLKAVFTFCLNLNIEGVKDTQVVQGCLMYFPNNFGEETLPLSSENNGSTTPMFQCFWQGRLAPLSFVNCLEFCAKPEGRSRKQRDRLPDACFNRIRGLLFFNYHTPISNNKLKILLDTQRDLSNAMSEASGMKKLPQEFKKWLQQCHRLYDNEVVFENPLPDSEQSKNEDIFYKQVKMVTPSGESIYKSGDIVKIDWKPLLLGKVIYFVKKAKSTDVSTIVYSRLPEDVFGDRLEEKPLIRIAGITEKETLESTFASERQFLPKYMKVFEGSDPGREVPKKLKFCAGVEMKDKTNFWVVVYNSSHEPITEVHQRKISVKVELTQRSELVNSQPIDKKYMFKPFYFDKVGKYMLTFSVLLNNNKVKPELSKSIEINIKANVAEILNLHESSPDKVPLGENVISFTLSFHDVYMNETNIFKDNETSVKLLISCEDLIISGVMDRYTPDKNGRLKVNDIAIFPNEKEVSRNRDYEFWIIAEGIGDVMFPIVLVTGAPEKCIIKKISKEYENYDSFPELEIKLVDKWNQPSTLQDKSILLAAVCDAFSQQFLLSTIVNSRAKFSSSSIKLTSVISSPVTKIVKIQLIIPNLSKKRPSIQSVLKTLYEFEIQIFPSKACQKIQIVHDDKQGNSENLHLSAVAGSLVKGLKIIGYNQKGEQMSEEDLLSQSPHVTASWAEVDALKLPLLPDLNVPTTAQATTQIVQCFIKYNGFEIRSEAKLKLNVLPDVAAKWGFVPLTLTAFCGGKKELTNATKVVAYDQYHNQASPMESVPVITVEHSKPDLKVEYSGSLVRCMDEFIFSSSSTLSGSVGNVILFVQDEHNKLLKDSIQIQLSCGPASKISLKCSLFKNDKNDEVPKISLFANSFIESNIYCCLTDFYGNSTSIKTGIKMVWEPQTAGASIIKETSRMGEVVFRANTVKCYADRGNVKLKVYAPDMSAVEPRFIDVHILQTNLVTSITLKVEETMFTASSLFPLIKVFHKTSDDVPAPVLKSNISFTIISPSGKSSDALTIYNNSLQSFTDDVLFCASDSSSHFMEAGVWTIQCSYIESRPALLDIAGKTPLKSEPVKIIVHPDSATQLASSLLKETVLFASLSSTDSSAHSLIPLRTTNNNSPHISLFVLDKYGNRVAINTKVQISIEPVDREKIGVNAVIPQLEKSCSSVEIIDGVASLPQITLTGKVGAKMGIYHLVFSDDNLEPLKIKFSYTTDEELKKITQRYVELNTELVSYKNDLTSKQMELEKCANKVNATLKMAANYFQSPKPTIQDIDIQILKIRNICYDYEMRTNDIRPCRKDPQHPPPNVRQYIKGLVCELAYVSDPNLARILSWYVQSKMRVAFCETREQQRKVYDLGCPAYSENLIKGFSRGNVSTNPENFLPIELPDPPPGFTSSISCAVNLLEFKERYSYLRSSLYWSVFSRTIVVTDLDHAQRYREHLTHLGHNCPAILTLSGDLLAADGLMDPQRRCPQRIEDLRYAFGELPSTEKKEYKDLQKERRRLEELRALTFDMINAEQAVQASVRNLSEKENTVLPLILKLEQKREHLKRMADEISSTLSPSKRRKQK